GFFTGDGSSLSNVSVAASHVLGTLSDANLSSNAALLNGSAAFAGTVTAASFAGNGDGWGNLNPANLTAPITVQQTCGGGHANDGGFARSVAVSGRYAYVADETNGLVVYDISNPALPVRVSQTNDGGNGWSVAVAGQYAYLANLADGLRI